MPLAEGRWLRLEQIEYVDRHGQRRQWEAANRQSCNGAVVVIAQLRPSGRYILVEQYRPPVDAPVLEFPAGLIDHGESAQQTAVRELLEETGYIGTVTRLCAPSLSSPGLTGESAVLAHMDVDETAPENQAPCPNQDDGEDITVFTVPEADIGAFIAKRHRQGVAMDSKVTAYFLGAGLL